MGKERRLFGLFCHNSSLRFNEIEKLSGLRSNEVAYYLNRLVKKGVLQKINERYQLSQDALKKIPYYREDEALSPLCAVIVRCANDKDEILMMVRDKRPYNGLWSLPGGRIVLGETVDEAVTRILKQKTFLDCRIARVRAVCNERVIEDGEIRHGFVFFVVDALATSSIVVKPNIKWVTSADDIKDDCIPSDYYFLTAEPGFYECTLYPCNNDEPTRYSAVIEKKESLVNSSIF